MFDVMGYTDILINFLNQNSGIIALVSLIFTGIVAVATIVYTKEVKKSREYQTKPYINMFVEGSIGESVICIKIENIGHGTAYNVKFNVLIDFEDENKKKVSDNPQLKYGIKKLDASQSVLLFNVNTWWLAMKELQRGVLNWPIPKCEICIYYEDAFECKHMNDFLLNLEKLTSELYDKYDIYNMTRVKMGKIERVDVPPYRRSFCGRVELALKIQINDEGQNVLNTLMKILKKMIK
ncbi:MAG: hypothetical protein WC974_04520 [Thermoplasmata archaeon]